MITKFPCVDFVGRVKGERTATHGHAILKAKVRKQEGWTKGNTIK